MAQQFDQLEWIKRPVGMDFKYCILATFRKAS